MTEPSQDPADLIDANQARYFKSDKGKEAQSRYSKSSKGREAQKRYHKTEKSKTSQERYRNSPKGRQAYERAKELKEARVNALTLARERDKEGLCITCGNIQCEVDGHIRSLPEVLKEDDTTSLSSL